MWSAMKAEVEGQGGIVRLNSPVVRVNRTGRRIDSVVVSASGTEEALPGTAFISSMPVSEFIQKLDPPPPPDVLEAAGKLTYRDFLTVCLFVNKPHLFPDNWIYVHDPAVKVGRIQNFKNWSPDMVPDPAKTSLGLEYFCSEGDELWNTPDADLIALGKREIEQIGLARAAEVEDGCVVRVPKAYPVYDSDYRDYLATVRQYVDGLENFQTVGRNGLHRYNNQDHAMVTGLLAVRNLVLGEQNDLWSVNTDQEYHEEVRVAEVEVPAVAEQLRAALTQVFGRLDRVAFGLSVGLTSGLLLSLATLWLVIKGGDPVGPNMQLLSNFLPGYRVTAGGGLLALVYGVVGGFAVGWVFALLRNVLLFLSMAVLRRRAQLRLLRRLLEYV